MQVLQMRHHPELMEVLLEQVNLWSRLSVNPIHDPGYVTGPFTESDFRYHTVQTDLQWVLWRDDATQTGVYWTLGDAGRQIADRFLGAGRLQGLLRLVPLDFSRPQDKLEIVEVVDLVASGYMLASGEQL